MDKNLEKDRILSLRAEVTRLRELYHVKNDPKVTDDVYDSLTRELRSLEAKFPEFRVQDDPTKRVAGAPLPKFKKVTHTLRMLSLNDVFTLEGLYDWEKRIQKLIPGKKIQYFSEIKFDGLAISLRYENGKLILGATRGDGTIGEDVTENIKMINDIPLTLPKPYQRTVEVRGEVLMSKKTLQKL